MNPEIRRLTELASDLAYRNPFPARKLIMVALMLHTLTHLSPL